MVASEMLRSLYHVPLSEMKMRLGWQGQRRDWCYSTTSTLQVPWRGPAPPDPIIALLTSFVLQTLTGKGRAPSPTRWSHRSAVPFPPLAAATAVEEEVGKVGSDKTGMDPRTDYKEPSGALVGQVGQL